MGVWSKAATSTDAPALAPAPAPGIWMIFIKFAFGRSKPVQPSTFRTSSPTHPCLSFGVDGPSASPPYASMSPPYAPDPPSVPRVPR
eukprot:7003830-Prymnesium_polylepis.1